MLFLLLAEDPVQGPLQHTLQETIKTSVADPFLFYTYPDPRIRFVKKRIRIRPNFFSSDYPKNYLLLHI